jgi:hypothetical protein
VETGAGRRRDEPTEWPNLQRDAVKAIVLDANAFGKNAALNIGLLKRLARDAREVGIAVWPPEPVLWELAP